VRCKTRSTAGHASLQTTSIDVRAGQRRMLEAAAQYYAEDEGEAKLPDEWNRWGSVGMRFASPNSPHTCV
jgi:hypothetical protein